MAGAQSTASAMPRLILALLCVVFVALAAAPAAIANTPAGDQYGQFLPGAGNGGGAGSSSGGGDSTSGGPGVTTVPVAPRSQSPNASTGGGGSSHSGQNGGSSSKHDGSTGGTATADPANSPAADSANSVPQIASNTAGDGWVPFFIAALVALAAATAALVYRNRRRAAHN
jgi:hypothetical protein